MSKIHHLLVETLPRDNERSYKHYMYRLSRFADWMTDTNRRWYEPDPAAYKQYLMEERGLAPSTVNSHLSTIRTRYRALLKDGTLHTAAQEVVSDPAQIDDLLEQLQSTLFSRKIMVKHKRDRNPDLQRLKAEHLITLFNAPDTDTPVGQRDQAFIAQVFTTGLREFEICALQVSDLYHELDGAPALHVPPGRGCTERLVPYYDLTWGRDLVEQWLEDAGITEGPVMRGFYRGGRTVRPTALSVRAAGYILSAYPITLDGERVAVTAMDLRRAYARLLFEAGFDLDIIMRNLGLKDTNSLMNYIGGSDASLDIPEGVDFSDPSTLGLTV